MCSHVGIAKFIKVFDHTGLFADSLVQVEHQMLLMRWKISSNSKWSLQQIFAKSEGGGLILERGTISSGYFSRKVYWQIFSSIIREVSVSFDIISMFWSPGLCSYDRSSPFTAWVLNRILHSLSLKSYLTEDLTAKSGFLSGYINSDHKCQPTRRNNTFTPSLL